ncbi:hypothetical protein [Paenibacillus agricola]|uniref:Uncharacterized protein n=1 Tax=Paenibacillus agricola TaxID=2716264 RepID=A0ABX0JK63_9BACL|nr:hypothetical protein [Paenibacillus agricola]NHN34391.1 hypothetical protein [Paenibacillus agricola]
MNKITARGMAPAKQEDFVYLMTQEQTIKEKIAQLFQIRKNGTLDENMTNRIKNVEFEQTVKNHPSRKGSAPDQYVHRFLCCVFMEIMTPIAKKNDLKEIGRILEIYDTSISFVHLQVRVTGKVEGSLERLNLLDEVAKWGSFRKAVIAYHILDANKETLKQRL